MFGGADVSDNVISFEGSKDPHIEAKKREKFEAMKQAFQEAREQASSKPTALNKKNKRNKPKKKR
jgi:hypothetical protein